MLRKNLQKQMMQKCMRRDLAVRTREIGTETVPLVIVSDVDFERIVIATEETMSAIVTAKEIGIEEIAK